MLKYLFANSSAVRAKEIPDDAEVFTYHEKSAIQALLGGFMMAAFVEATVLHILLAYWNHWIALVATLSTVWVVFQIVAQIRAAAMRPVFIADNKLVLRNGAFDLATIPLDRIATVDVTIHDPDYDDSEPKPLHVSFPASHSVVVTLTEPAQATILNRRQRDFQIALIAIDDADRFATSIETHLQSRYAEAIVD
ncbi:MAG: hypothetical protein AAF456_03410 [Planctomycetota bacterium]